MRNFEGDNTINRRQFLKWTGTAALALALPPGGLHASGPAEVPVPPSLMLHSRHRWRLEPMLVTLCREGFEGVKSEIFCKSGGVASD